MVTAAAVMGEVAWRGDYSGLKASAVRGAWSPNSCRRSCRGQDWSVLLSVTQSPDGDPQHSSTPPDRRILLEVCVESVDDALTAYRSGADRLELNSGLMLGGLTPSLGVIREVRRAVPLPLMVMIRPRSGGFHYSPNEYLVMHRDAELAIQAGADGIVFGILTAQGEIDVARCDHLASVAERRERVFHRAFDVVRDPFASLEQLIALGFQRVMTSGQANTAVEGAIRIRSLLAIASGRIEILPAGGLNRATVEPIVQLTGAGQIHGSLRVTERDCSTSARPEIQFGARTIPPEDTFHRTSGEAVAEIRSLLDRLQSGLPRAEISH